MADQTGPRLGRRALLVSVAAGLGGCSALGLRRTTREPFDAPTVDTDDGDDDTGGLASVRTAPGPAMLAATTTPRVAPALSTAPVYPFGQWYQSSPFDVSVEELTLRDRFYERGAANRNIVPDDGHVAVVDVVLRNGRSTAVTINRRPWGVVYDGAFFPQVTCVTSDERPTCTDFSDTERADRIPVYRRGISFGPDSVAALWVPVLVPDEVTREDLDVAYVAGSGGVSPTPAVVVFRRSGTETTGTPATETSATRTTSTNGSDGNVDR